MHRFSSELLRSHPVNYGQTVFPPFPLNSMTGSGYGSLHSRMLINRETDFCATCEAQCIDRFSSGLLRSHPGNYGHTVFPPFPLNIMTRSCCGSLHSPMLIQCETYFWAPCEAQCIDFRQDCFARMLRITATLRHRHFS